MTSYLPFIVIGLTTGSVYGIAALGLVLTYKTSGVFNFGYGAIAALSAVVFYALHVRAGVPTPVAVFAAVILFGVVAGLVMERLAMALADAPLAYRVVATVGIVVSAPAVFNLAYGPLAKSFPSILPNTVAFTISGVRVAWSSVATMLIGVASAVALYTFLRRSRLGVAMRAVVDRPELVDLTGYSPAHIRRVAWIVGCSFAAVSGLLFANTQEQLDVLLLSLLVIQAFGAATVGAFRSLPLAFAGGLAVGVAQGIASRLTSTNTSLSGLDTNMPFLFLFVGLLVIPKGRLIELGQRGLGHMASGRPLWPAKTRRIGLAVVVAGAVLVPFLVGTKLPSWNVAMAYIPLFLSLGLLVHTSGQISLCQIGFAAIGATTFAHMIGSGVPWGVAVLIGGLVTIPVGALIAIPAIRLSGLFLGLATLGFGVLLNQFFYTKSYMFGSTSALMTTRPHVFGLNTTRGYYFVLLGVALAAGFLIVRVERSRLGRLLRAMASSPTGLSTLGTNVEVTRVLVFCISAFVAGVSGGLYAGLFGGINSDSFSYFQSLIVLSILVVCGRRTVPAAIIGALALTLPTAYLSGGNVLNWEQVIFGCAAIAAGVASTGRVSNFFLHSAARHRDRRVGPAGVRMAPTPSDRPSIAVSIHS